MIWWQLGNNAFLNGTPLYDGDLGHSNDLGTSMTWVAGPLGNYYQPDDSPLLNKGNTNANLLDMANYTVLTNQSAEGTSLISIGYHYYSLLNASSATVSVLSPTNGQVFNYSAGDIAILAQASASNSLITNVQFYIDGTSLGNGTTNSNPPGDYSLDWTSLTVGWHTLTAWTWNNAGQSNSASVNIAVDCAQASLSSLAFSNSPASDGSPITGTITLSNAASTYGQVITLGSDNTNVIPPLSVFIAGGQSDTNFTIQTLPVTNTTTVHVWASYHGQSITNTVTLNPYIDTSLPVIQPNYGGFILSTVVTNFIPSGENVGPEGMVINNLGQLMIGMPQEAVPGNSSHYALYVLPTDRDGQSINITTNGMGQLVGVGMSRVDLGGFQIEGLARVGSQIYCAYNNFTNGGHESGVAQLSDEGEVLRTLPIIPFSTTSQATTLGLAANPQTGHLYVTTGTQGEDFVAGQAYDIDPNLWSASLFIQGDDSFDGISLALDGQTLYVAVGDDSVLGFDTSSKAKVLNLTIPSTCGNGLTGATADGTANGEGMLAGKLYVNCNDGTFWEVDQKTGAMNLVFTNGSRGDFVQVDINDGTLLITQSDRILRLSPPPGGYFGRSSGIICSRNDITTNYSTITLSNALPMEDSSQTATFDLRGVAGAVLAATFTRTDTVGYCSSGDIDLELGLQSVASDPFPTSSWSLPVHLPPTSSSGITNLPFESTWSLSQSNIVKVQQQLGAVYQVNLADRISSVCATFALTNYPQSQWPQARNTLTLLVMGDTNPQIPQGQSLDISMPGPGKTINGDWLILLNGLVVASSGNPNGWNVEDDHNTPGTVLNGDIVTAPASATIATGYEVDVGGANARVGYFEVIPSGNVAPAPVLLPILLSTIDVLTNGSFAITVALDRPAPAEGATIVLGSSSTNITLPAYIVIPTNGTSSNVTANVGSGAMAGVYTVTASFNGLLRQASLHVINSSGFAPAVPTGLTASVATGSVTNTWNAVTGALSYNVKRAFVTGGPYATLFGNLQTNNYTDAQIINGTTYYYVVSAVNAYGESANSSEVSATPSRLTVATPVISVLSTNTTNIVVGITDATPGAIIYYTLDGSAPTAGSTIYSSPISLADSSTIVAQAFASGYLPSVVATASLTVTVTAAARTAGVIDCGDVINSYLGIVTTSSTTNVDYSWFKGQGFYAQHYQISVPDTNAGGTLTIAMSSGQVDSFTFLTDGSTTNILASNDNDFPGTPNSRITYTIPTNSTKTNYYIEATTAVPGQTGNFVLLLDCGTVSPQIQYYGLQFDGQSYLDFSTNQVNLGTVPINTPATALLYILNDSNGAFPDTETGLDLKRLIMTGDFIISPQTLPALPYNGYLRTNLSIMLASFNAGTKTGTLTISNNTVTNPITLHFTATVAIPPSPVFNSLTTSPTSGNLAISASASEVNGIISKVDFYASQVTGGITNTLKIGQVAGANLPYYVITWHQPVPGTYTLIAIATDSLGNTVSTNNACTIAALLSFDTYQGAPTITPSSGY